MGFLCNAMHEGLSHNTFTKKVVVTCRTVSVSCSLVFICDIQLAAQCPRNQNHRGMINDNWPIS